MISPHRSQKHLKFVRSRACAFCLHPASEAHHHSKRASGGGVGLKGCDLLTVPLCAKHHREIHKTGSVEPYSVPETQAEIWKAIALCLRERVLEEKT